MRLFIAEKPSLAAAIAEGLGNPRKQSGYWQCDGDNLVTWCFGHMLENLSPESYNPDWKIWRKADLPLIPKEWLYAVRSDAEAQLSVIRTLLSKAASVVNAGDPDREGQLLVDELLTDYTGPVERLWLASLDARSVAKALSSMKDNREYAPLRDAALARSLADWLVGLNATRAMTLLGRDAGYTGVLSLGRVQTPTLALVVARDQEIEAFKPHPYFVLQAHVEHPAGAFVATFVPGDDQAGLDDQGRLVDQAVAADLIKRVAGMSGIVASVTKQEKKKTPELPHCLSSLQKAASAAFGMTAQQVLDIAQALYEKKLTTYPRTDCRYLPAEQFADAQRLLSSLEAVPALEAMAKDADPSRKSAAWDTGKVTAHHAIIPTGEAPAALPDAEMQVYTMIATAYCLQFHPDYRYEAQKLTAEFRGTAWTATGRVVLEPGWTRFARDEDDAKQQGLPAVGQGDAVACNKVDRVDKKTAPPPRFTEGSLIEAMANVHRFVADVGAKVVLKENEGIGTEATRAGILETLKVRGFLQISGKATLVSTQLGRQLIALTPDTLKDPVTTAAWERRLSAIAAGADTLDAFMADQTDALPGLLAPLLAADAAFPAAYPCPQCGKPMRRHKSKQKEGEFFWSCAGYPDCKYSLPDDHGKPGKRVPQIVSNHKCPSCGKGMIRKASKKKPGKYFWSCSGYPECKGLCFDKQGRPDFSTFKAG